VARRNVANVSIRSLVGNPELEKAEIDQRDRDRLQAEAREVFQGQPATTEYTILLLGKGGEWVPTPPNMRDWVFATDEKNALLVAKALYPDATVTVRVDAERNRMGELPPSWTEVDTSTEDDADDGALDREAERRNLLTERVPPHSNPMIDTARHLTDDELIEAVRLASDQPADLAFTSEEERIDWLGVMTSEVMRRSTPIRELARLRRTVDTVIQIDRGNRK
jgi:hypothetical protein